MKLPEPLDDLSPDEQEILQQYLEPVRFPAGTRLFQEGSPGDGCYIIDEGEVRLEVQRPEVDSDGVLGFLGAGTILGELSLLDRLPRSTGAYSHTDVAARRL
ncbi:MAG TPA: cyclic nucleotide-binding domain-containing protein, partial [Gemmatimonadales bacterium]